MRVSDKARAREPTRLRAKILTAVLVVLFLILLFIGWNIADFFLTPFFDVNGY